MKKNLKKINDVVIYQAKNGAIELRGDFSRETIWATQAQIAQLFGVTPQNVTLHLGNIFKDKELEIKATCKDSLQVQIEGNREIERVIKFYNLDAIIAVGYRINSVLGTNFRIWATKTLREHITKGYTFNKKIILKNYDQFLKNVTDIQALLPIHFVFDPKAILDLVKEYSTTWAKLDAYDRDTLIKTGITKKKITLAGQELLQAIFELKNELIKKYEATDIFANERESGSIEGIVGNVMQSFSGNDVYETLEEKAGHLFYFMVKNHPFIDGNKRSGAFAFIWFLRRNGVRGAHNINPAGLTAITLLIAESDSKYKDKMVALVVELLRVHRK
ncbi:MAG: virulence protein RhuM/Fic/DOC family protein [Candidatus Parcubacteria bacterium]|nr:virulence protein RhuM/Fic/DOC family protein [Candidatus Parcubacteria bacterium]